MTRDGGKGDTPRPLGVPMEQFDNQWEKIFGEKNKPKEVDKQKKQEENND